MAAGPATTNVLVTAAGSAPAVAVIRALQQQSEIPVRVVAADMDPLAVGFHLADAWALLPAATAPGFVPTVIEICRRHAVRVVFPIIDEELQRFADAAATFAAAGIDVVTAPADVVRRAKDKWLTAEWCRQYEVLAPRTWRAESRPAALPYPVIVKPRSGRGSVGVALVGSEAELEFHIALGTDLLIQEYVDGPEYTVDILANRSGQVLSAVPRERLMTKAGMCVKGRTVNPPALLELAVRIAEEFGLTPRGNLQFKQCNRDGRYYLIEVNPKFGAGLPITTAAGVNMPLLLLKLLRGDAVPPMIGEFQSDLVMLRHWAEVFVPGDALAATEAPGSQAGIPASALATR